MALTATSLIHPLAADESAADFFRKDREYWSKGLRAPETPSWAGTLDLSAMVPDRFRCHVLGPKTRHGRAVGPLQVMPKSAEAFGISSYDLHRDCKAQITAGILHMEKCISVGAQTYNQLAACHVAGWGGWNKKLNRKAQAYRAKYVRMAQASKVPSWAGTLYTW